MGFSDDGESAGIVENGQKKSKGKEKEIVNTQRMFLVTQQNKSIHGLLSLV